MLIFLATNSAFAFDCADVQKLLDLELPPQIIANTLADVPEQYRRALVPCTVALELPEPDPDRLRASDAPMVVLRGHVEDMRPGVSLDLCGFDASAGLQADGSFRVAAPADLECDLQVADSKGYLGAPIRIRPDTPQEGLVLKASRL